MGNMQDREVAIFAGGCFWGVEHVMRKMADIESIEAGYIGGRADIVSPTYEQVCTGNTGYVEAVRIVFDPRKESYDHLCRLFFEIHDPTQRDGQGPDIGEQYRSVIFYTSPCQLRTARTVIGELTAKGYDVATELREATPFYRAEEYHQDYYTKKGTSPYCHSYTKRF